MAENFKGLHILSIAANRILWQSTVPMHGRLFHSKQYSFDFELEHIYLLPPVIKDYQLVKEFFDKLRIWDDVEKSYNENRSR